MRFYRNLFLGKGAEIDKKFILHQLKAYKPVMGVYVITPAANGVDLLDICPSRAIKKDSFRGTKMQILGIAIGYSEALEVASSIVMEVYTKTGGFDIRSYFSW